MALLRMYPSTWRKAGLLAFIQRNICSTLKTALHFSNIIFSQVFLKSLKNQVYHNKYMIGSTIFTMSAVFLTWKDVLQHSSWGNLVCTPYYSHLTPYYSQLNADPSQDHSAGPQADFWTQAIQVSHPEIFQLNLFLPANLFQTTQILQKVVSESSLQPQMVTSEFI